jgi:hypothetical protein
MYHNSQFEDTVPPPDQRYSGWGLLFRALFPMFFRKVPYSWVVGSNLPYQPRLKCKCHACCAGQPQACVSRLTLDELRERTKHLRPYGRARGCPMGGGWREVPGCRCVLCVSRRYSNYRKEVHS